MTPQFDLTAHLNSQEPETYWNFIFRDETHETQSKNLTEAMKAAERFYDEFLNDEYKLENGDQFEEDVTYIEIDRETGDIVAKFDSYIEYEEYDVQQHAYPF